MNLQSPTEFHALNESEISIQDAQAFIIKASKANNKSYERLTNQLEVFIENAKKNKKDKFNISSSDEQKIKTFK